MGLLHRRTYHYYEHTADHHKKHVRFHFDMFFGDIYMLLVREGKPPGFAIRQKNLFMLPMEGRINASVDICNVKVGACGLCGGEMGNNPVVETSCALGKGL